jgi:2-polyprenyl-6-methoxyphenol hydroxylase-like FAD-dependent oxidoreductase
MAVHKPESPNFRVIIAGGGIAGLTLANALQHAKIDYILLERRDTITPQTGASLGLMSNGGRILDQLNVHSTLEGEMDPLTFFCERWSDGKPLKPRADLPVLLQQRLIRLNSCFHVAN